MKLYDRDYFYITDDEKKDIGEATKKYTYKLGKLSGNGSSLFREQPKAGRHYQSLFPNNYLDIVDLDNEERLNKLNLKFTELINIETTKEQDILNFLNSKENKAYHIIGSLLRAYDFGHHDTFLFPEFQLGTSYKVDYLLIGSQSGGHKFVFVELESCYRRITRKSGAFGATTRKGIDQIEDWKIWLNSNYSNLREIFNSYCNGRKLPREFYEFDSTRMNYIVISGRRSDFNEKTYTLKRNLKKESGISLLHYDNLIDSANAIVGQPNY